MGCEENHISMSLIKPLKNLMRLVVIVAIGMWLFKKHCQSGHDQKVGDRNKIKALSTEWEGLSSELAVIQQAFELEQITYNNAVQNMANQRYAYTFAYDELNEMKADLSSYLRNNVINVDVFKNLTDECMIAYSKYEHEHQKMVEMDNDFNDAYSKWDSKCEGRLSKINEMRLRIKDIETEIKNLCSDIGF